MNLKKCECGRFMKPIDSEIGERDYFPKNCEVCELRIQENLRKIAEVARDSSESECFRIMAWLLKRIEYLRGEDLKRLAGFHAN